MSIVRQATLFSPMGFHRLHTARPPGVVTSTSGVRQRYHLISPVRQTNPIDDIVVRDLSYVISYIRYLLEVHLRAAMQGPRNLFPYERAGRRHRGARACVRPVERWPRARIPPSVPPDTGQSTRSGHLRPGY